MGNSPPACIGTVVTRNCSSSCPSGQRNDGTNCWDDFKTTCSGGYATRNAPTSCPDGFHFLSTDIDKIGPCYNNDPQSYVPDTYAKKSVSRGTATSPSTPAPITCGTNCCMFDLTFYNPSYIKPSNLALPAIPITNGLIGYYDASSFLNNVWYDLSSFNNNVTQLNGSFTLNNKTFISGSSTSTILFPTQILPSTYTLFHIAKYNGTSKGKILAGYNNPNWYSGFANAKSGIAAHTTPITQTSLSAFENNWVFSTDTNITYRANGASYTTISIDPTNSNAQLSINLNTNNSDNSDFAIACVIVFNRTLSSSEISTMENWLTTTYNTLWATTYNKTFQQLGYSCFNERIGKVTNNYTNYTLASYGEGPLSCEWLGLPEKTNFDALTCESTTNLHYEKFTMFDENNFLDFKFLILIILIILIMVLKAYKKI